MHPYACIRGALLALPASGCLLESKCLARGVGLACNFRWGCKRGHGPDSSCLPLLAPLPPAGIAESHMHA